MKFEKGKAVPLTPEEKVAQALKVGVSEHYPDRATWVKSMSIDSHDVTQLDDKKTRIKAHGNCTLGFKCLKRDAILMDKNCKFEIDLEDIKDELGLPDVKVLRSKVTEV
jgi:hypothetical protein